MSVIALLLTAILFGGMTFFSFGFASVLFKQLPMDKVRPLLRGTFPYYYLVVIVLATICAAVSAFSSTTAAIILAVIGASTLYARQLLMYQINDAADCKDDAAFKRLHGLSIVIQLIQIGLAGWAVVLLA